MRDPRGDSPGVAGPLNLIDPGTTATCTRAWQALRVAHDRVARRLAADLARECGLAVTEFDVLDHLRARPGEAVRVGTLSGAVALSQPALSRLVTRLEGRGLIIRSAANDDGRVCVVRLTGAGVELVDRATVVYARAVHETLTVTLPDEDHVTLLRTLARIGGELPISG
ncbi:MAG: MarR family winged helix-turn-helix transcriptional regulator [Chloroflexota bacterium]|nr:MarR family winged helix-turn-helix transcriptional regulator [Chloroflexota bacterium]